MLLLTIFFFSYKLKQSPCGDAYACESGEMADTLDLGSSALGVRVQVPPLAIRGNSSVVERHLAKVDVAGPTPVFRSRPIGQKAFAEIAQW